MGQVNESENRSKISLVQRVRKKQTNYLTDFRQADKLKYQLETAPGVLTLECLETNMVSSGWLTLTQNIKDKPTDGKQRHPNRKTLVVTVLAY